MDPGDPVTRPDRAEAGGMAGHRFDALRATVMAELAQSRERLLALEEAATAMEVLAPYAKHGASVWAALAEGARQGKRQEALTLIAAVRKVGRLGEPLRFPDSDRD